MKMHNLENEWVNDIHKEKCKGSASVRCLGERWKKVLKRVREKPRKKTDEEMDQWLKEKLGEDVHVSHTSMLNFIA